MNYLDLCISFDDTGSMSSVRRQVRQKIKELLNNLKIDIPGLRIAMIIHNDYCDSPNHIFTLDFTTDFNNIEKFINQYSPCGGGDAPECYELALHEARSFSWQSDKRVMILIGDEVPHHVGYSLRGRVVNTYDWVEETKGLNELGVNIYGVQALGDRASTNFYTTISRMTNGVKLDLSQFQHINTYINAIVYQQNGQLDTYQESDPTFKTNLSLKNMFRKLKGFDGSADIESSMTLLSKFQMMKVEDEAEIRTFVENMGCTFRKGRGFYQLIERTADGKANVEEIQANKEVIFIDKETGEAFDDTEWCREKLGIPYGVKGKVRPLQLPDLMNKYNIFIQSNSYTRKLDAGTNFLYELEAR